MTPVRKLGAEVDVTKNSPLQKRRYLRREREILSGLYCANNMYTWAVSHALIRTFIIFGQAMCHEYRGSLRATPHAPHESLINCYGKLIYSYFI